MTGADTRTDPAIVAPPDAQAVRAHANTWGSEIQTYEFAKRKAVHADTMMGPPIRVTYGLIKQQERLFDPILQRYRLPDTEYGMRAREEEVRLHHLNRAMDIQLLREQPYNVVNNSSKLEGLAPEVDIRTFQAGHKNGRPKLPDTFTDYNILSNLPMSQHHWAPPEARPLPGVKEGKVRKVPTFLLKDFNIITNRYLEDHHNKRARDDELNLLECTAKYRTRNKFDPVIQEYNDPDEEERLRKWSDAHEVELVEQAQQKIPPSQKNRATAFYNPVSHEVCDGDMLQWMDVAEAERKERFMNKYVYEHNWHLQDIKANHVNNERKLNKIALSRFEEPLKRGYCIVSHQRCEGRHSKQPFLPYSHPTPSVWQRVCNGTMEPQNVLTTRAASVPPSAHCSAASTSAKHSPARSIPGSATYGSPTPKDFCSPVPQKDHGSPVPQKDQTHAAPRDIPTEDGVKVPSRRSSANMVAKGDTDAAKRASSQQRTTAYVSPSDISVMTPSARSAVSSKAHEGSQSASHLPAVRHSVHAVPKISIPRKSTPVVQYAPPPAPSLPGSDGGSVYSKPCNPVK
eukprot:GEMP01014536.1.p1 GENE.GEMP01014536.1~~GEMP01014536.1.p1  ORF type:complete len:580 (+),score=130.74 GEMP01014536.1:32-1741(+)